MDVIVWFLMFDIKTYKLDFLGGKSVIAVQTVCELPYFFQKQSFKELEFRHVADSKNHGS